MQMLQRFGDLSDIPPIAFDKSKLQQSSEIDAVHDNLI